jgi:hypothetical protein
MTAPPQPTPPADAYIVQLEIALRVLARLVWDDNPSDMSLADIAFIWGHATDEEMAALVTLEQTHVIPSNRS